MLVSVESDLSLCELAWSLISSCVSQSEVSDGIFIMTKDGNSHGRKNTEKEISHWKKKLWTKLTLVEQIS